MTPNLYDVATGGATFDAETQTVTVTNRTFNVPDWIGDRAATALRCAVLAGDHGGVGSGNDFTPGRRGGRLCDPISEEQFHSSSFPWTIYP